MRTSNESAKQRGQSNDFFQDKKGTKAANSHDIDFGFIPSSQDAIVTNEGLGWDSRAKKMVHNPGGDEVLHPGCWVGWGVVPSYGFITRSTRCGVNY